MLQHIFQHLEMSNLLILFLEKHLVQINVITGKFSPMKKVSDAEKAVRKYGELEKLKFSTINKT